MKNSFKLFLAALFAVSSVLFNSNLLYAKDTDGVDNDKPRNFALGIATLKEHGFGVNARIRYNHLALDGSAGFYPIILMYQYSDGTTEYDGTMSPHADMGLILFFNDEMKRFQMGIRVSGIYDSVLGKGMMGGLVGDLTFDYWAICFGLGIQYYPDFVKNINKEFPDTRNADMSESERYQAYIGVNFIRYIF